MDVDSIITTLYVGKLPTKNFPRIIEQSITFPILDEVVVASAPHRDSSIVRGHNLGIVAARPAHSQKR